MASLKNELKVAYLRLKFGAWQQRFTLAEIRRIRAEQDAAFQETLRLDQERERQKLEAEEAEKARIQAEIDRKENIARQKIELAKDSF